MDTPASEREAALRAELERLREQLRRAGLEPARPDAGGEHTQARLQEREEQLRLAQEAGGIGTFSVEIATHLMTVTPAVCRLFGIPPVDTLPASEVEALVIPEDQHLRSSAESRERGVAPPSVEYRIRQRDTGELRWISRRAGFIRDAQGRPLRLTGVLQDVTERRRAEDALREANERLQLALDAGAVIGTWMWDVPIDRFTADARFARAFSVDPELAAQGLPLSIVIESIHPEDKARIVALIQRTMETGGAYRAEYRVRQVDGSYLWIEANGHCELSAEGRPLRFPGVLIDIDERKRAELRQAALVEIGDRLRDLDDPADIARTAMEVVGRLFGVMRAGYGSVDEAQQRVDMHRNWVSHPHVQPVVGVHRFSDYGVFIEDLKRGETVNIPDIEKDPRTASETHNLLAIGIRALLNVPLLEHGRFVAVLFLHDAVARDWTADELAFMRNVADRIWSSSERVRVLLELRHANEALEQRAQQRTRERDRIWNVSRDLLLVADMEGRFLNVNPAWTRQLGWSEEELLGRTSAWMEHPDDQVKTRAEVSHLAEGQSTQRFENSFRHRDGTYRHLSWTAVPVPEEGVIYAAARDITEQRQTEAQLHQAQKMEAVGQLTGGVAHDFNNLLQVISGNLQLLQRDVAGSERARSRLQAAVGAVDRGARLAAQLLAFARRQPLEPQVINLGRLVHGMDELLRRALGEDIEIQTAVGEGLWNTFADPHQLENVVLNLAINARDAMEKNGRLLIEVGNTTLDAHHAQLYPEVTPGPYVLLAVSDTGCGMPPEVVARVFEPFFTTKPEGRGTGLGLSMVYGFVKQSGGHVNIYSEVGVGTTIRIYLPRAHQVESSVPELPVGPVVGGNEAILVAEDDPAVRATVVELLGELGYQVFKAVDGKSALAILQSGLHVDLLFTDVVMPGPLRSTDLARQARELIPDLEILFTSGYTEDAIVHGGRLDPGVHLLSKPHRREDLARKVRHLLDQRPQRQTHAAPPPPPAPPARLRVLLVEDNEDIRASASELLELLGHDVLAVESAEEAATALMAGPYDVLFTDVTLPGRSGVELAREAVGRTPGLRVILASGHGSSALPENEAWLDGVIVLPKPYALTEIERALEQARRAPR